MDPGLDEDDADARAMAEAMGFTSFGSHKPPAKKRKFNATTDAFVEGQDLAKLDKGGKKGQGSGGNTIPIGKHRVIGAKIPATETKSEPAGGNENEIDLDDEDEEEGGPRYLDTSLPPPVDTAKSWNPLYLDTIRPPPASEDEAKEMQDRIYALLASLNEPVKPVVSAPTASVPVASYQLSQRSHSPPKQYAGAPVTSNPRLKRGQRNENWYIGYFDPSFIENPWERLEEEKGLETLSRWPEKVDWQGHR